MRCELCGLREGIPTTIIINNSRTTKFICRECSLKKIADREKALRQRHAEEVSEFFGHALFNEPFGAFFPFAQFVQPIKAKEAACSKCGRTLDEFRETSLVGCPYCYEAFSPIMKQVLEQCQPKTAHVGKAPDGSSNKNAEYEHLLALLDRAIFEKRFGDADQIQKQIERLKNGL